MPLAIVKDDPPLSAARNELARLNAAVMVARDELDRANEPEQRLVAVVAELDRAEAELVALHAEDDRILAAWIGGDDFLLARPSPSDATLACELRLRRLRDDAGAARQALPELQAKTQALAEALVALSAQQRSAIYRCALEAVETFCSEQLKPAIEQVMAIESVARGMERHLWSVGHRDNDAEALGIASRSANC
jgi:hypothetical protein